MQLAKQKQLPTDVTGRIITSMEKEVYLVEELELRLSIEAVNYHRYIDDFPPSHEFDPQHFNRFITGPLLSEFVQTIYERTKKLNNTEINRYLNISLSQFKTHKPELREQQMKEQYWKDYWHPNLEPNHYSTMSEWDSKYFAHVFKWYSLHFQLFEEATQKAVEEFKAGLLGTPAVNISAPELPKEKIKYDSFNIFIKHLEYNYQYNTTVISFKYSMKENLDYLKKEILTNLIALNKDEKKAYLNRLKYDLENHQQHVWSTAEILDKWYEKYNSPKENDTFFKNSDNTLYQILTSDKPKFKDVYEEGYNEDTEQIQDEFYNYYYGFYINAALNFIQEQIYELDPAIIPNPSASALQAQNPKLKLNITVPQLVYLFKMLHDIKPQIFDIETKTELSNFIAANFITKATKTNGISPDSVYNLFSSTEKKDANFWVDMLKKMLEDARKV